MSAIIGACGYTQLRADLATASENYDTLERQSKATALQLATVTAERDAAVNGACAAWGAKFDAERLAHAETRKALEECSGRLTHAEGTSRVRLGALEYTRAELAKVTAELAEWKRVAAEHCDSLDIINEACEVAESSLTATRAELASRRRTAEKLEARVKELEAALLGTGIEARVKAAAYELRCWQEFGEKAYVERALEALRG